MGGRSGPPTWVGARGTHAHRRTDAPIDCWSIQRHTQTDRPPIEPPVTHSPALPRPLPQVPPDDDHSINKASPALLLLRRLTRNRPLRPSRLDSSPQLHISRGKMVEQKLPTLQQIKKAIPERCFKVRLDICVSQWAGEPAGWPVRQNAPHAAGARWHGRVDRPIDRPSV